MFLPLARDVQVNPTAASIFMIEEVRDQLVSTVFVPNSKNCDQVRVRETVKMVGWLIVRMVGEIVFIMLGGKGGDSISPTE